MRGVLARQLPSACRPLTLTLPFNFPPLLQATFTRLLEDRGVNEAAAIRLPPSEEGCTKLRLDIGWSTWKKPKVGLWRKWAGLHHSRVSECVVC